MESQGGRRSGIHRDSAKDSTPLINPIMLRFRPIAPKPAAGDSSAGSVVQESLSRPLTRRKVKRKYVRVQKKNHCNGNNDSANRSVPADGREAGSESVSALETLHLFSQNRGSLDTTDPLRLHLHTVETLPGTSSLPDPKVVESLVTVESVGDACGVEDHARSLELDSSDPSFVTDYSFSRVLRVNEAYTRLVSGGGESSAVVSVRLLVKEDLPQHRPAFTCQVRVEHTCQNQKYSKLFPCDVWKVEEWGGFAWRLDVKTALSLGFS